MRSFAFALAAVATVTGSGSVLAQCNCGRSAAPVSVRNGAVAQPTYQLTPACSVGLATSSSCCTVSASSMTPGGHQHHGVIVPGSTAVPEEPAKEVKLTGTMVCGKCNLKLTPKCSNVLQVKEGDKVVNYFLDDKGMGETYHEAVCGGDKVEGVNVTGSVTEKDGKKYVKPTKVETKK